MLYDVTNSLVILIVPFDILKLKFDFIGGELWFVKVKRLDMKARVFERVERNFQNELVRFGAKGIVFTILFTIFFTYLIVLCFKSKNINSNIDHFRYIYIVLCKL